MNEVKYNKKMFFLTVPVLYWISNFNVKGRLFWLPLGMLSRLHNLLVEAYKTHQRMEVVHPKVSHVVGYMTEWLTRKKQKSPKHDVKVKNARHFRYQKHLNGEDMW